MKYLRIYEEYKEYTFQDWFYQKHGNDDFTNINNLEIRRTNLTNLKGIENLVNLEYLCCTYNEKLDNLKGIEELIKLTSLGCYSNNQKSIKEVRNLINLKEFYPLFIPMGTLEDIEKLINLEDFECCACELTSLKGIENKTNLHRLLCYNNQLKNLDEIKNLSNLELFACEPNPWEAPLPYNIVKKFDIYYDTKKFQSYEFQKEFLEEHPEKAQDLIPVEFNKKIKEEYKDLIEFFDVKS